MVFGILSRIDMHFKRRKIRKTARNLAKQLLLSPNDHQLYQTKAINLAWQARMSLMDGPAKQEPPPTGNFSADLANALVAESEAVSEHYNNVASLLAQAAEAIYLALQLTKGKLSATAAEYYWQDWRQKAMTRCREALMIGDRDPVARQDAYRKALRWLTGVLSQAPQDAEMCYLTAFLLLNEDRYDDAIPFFLFVFAVAERAFAATGRAQEAFVSAFEPALLAAEKVREKQSAACLLRGSIFLLRREYEEVEAELKRVPELEQDKTSLFCCISYRQRAKALEAAGHAAEAAGMLRKAEELLQQRGVGR
jgi:tetratricopeptide (TPR) repeat protein